MAMQRALGRNSDTELPLGVPSAMKTGLPTVLEDQPLSSKATKIPVCPEGKTPFPVGLKIRASSQRLFSDLFKNSFSFLPHFSLLE